MTAIWAEIEQTLVDLYNLPHNRLALQGRNTTPLAAAKSKVKEVKSGLASVTRKQFCGPALFLRVTASANRAYSGEWWFDAKLLDTLDSVYSRIYFRTTEKKRVLRDMLRELLAVSTEWNKITEVWVLGLPPGQTLKGYTGPGTPQKLFANLPLTANGNRMLVGKAQQVFFPVKNPLWVKKYRSLAT